MIYFSFESIHELHDRPVLGLGELPGVRRAPIVSEVTIDGVTCYSSLPNHGAFGQNYDAQVTNIDIIPGMHGNAGTFDLDSRAAVLGQGPHTAGKAVSYSLWIRTTQGGKRILVSYEGYWTKKKVMNLRLRNGIPELSYSSTQQIRAQSGRVNDGLWHHLGVVMPSDDCLLSDIILYVDGFAASNELIGDDEIVNFPNGGVISIAGFGYGSWASDEVKREGFKGGARFAGDIDDVYVWAKSLKVEEMKQLATPPKTFALRSKISYRNNNAMCVGFGLTINELALQDCNDAVTQMWVIDALGFIHSKTFYQKCFGQESLSLKLVDCNEHDTRNSRWKITSDGLIQYLSDQTFTLTVNESDGNALVIRKYTNPELQNWDVVYEDMGILPSFLTTAPSSMPSLNPSQHPTSTPSSYPTTSPTLSPSLSPSYKPSVNPTSSPSIVPSSYPTSSPTLSPSLSPSHKPSANPTSIPSTVPSAYPTSSPSIAPSLAPSDHPTIGTRSPSSIPSTVPSNSPTLPPSLPPSASPTSKPSVQPTKSPSPTLRPTMCEEQQDGFGKFATAPGRPLKSCLQAQSQPRLCKYPSIQSNCPIACSLDCNAQLSSPSSDCKDSDVPFSNSNGSEYSCIDATTDPDLWCTQGWFQKNVE